MELNTKQRSRYHSKVDSSPATESSLIFRNRLFAMFNLINLVNQEKKTVSNLALKRSISDVVMDHTYGSYRSDLGSEFLNGHLILTLKPVQFPNLKT